MRPGFDKFFRKVKIMAKAGRHRFRLVPCGSRSETRKDFEDACRRKPGATNILLIDAEGAIDRTMPRDDRHVYMVELMESWFLANRGSAVEVFYGNCLRKASLPANPDIERIPKHDVLTGLDNATRDCPKGQYSKNKVDHALGILERLDPAHVRAASPECDRIFETLRRLVGD
ncbi:MAG: DUF4276 family protein [Bryobacteraceae bacterium]